MPVRFPVRGITAAQPEQRVLRLRQRQIVPKHLDDENRHVDVIEEIQIHMRHAEGHGDGMGAGECDPYLGDIAATKYTNAGLLLDVPVAPFSFSVEEALDVGEECDELAVMPFLKLMRVARELRSEERRVGEEWRA